MIDARGMRGRSWCGRRTRQMDVARLPTTPSRGRRNSVACTLGSPFAFRVHPPRLRLSRPRRLLVHLSTKAEGREGGRESYTSGVVSQFLPYMPPPMRINFFLAEKRSGNRAPLLFLLRTKLREAREARQRSTSFP